MIMTRTVLIHGKIHYIKKTNQGYYLANSNNNAYSLTYVERKTLLDHLKIKDINEYSMFPFIPTIALMKKAIVFINTHCDASVVKYVNLPSTDNNTFTNIISTLRTAKEKALLQLNKTNLTGSEHREVDNAMQHLCLAIAHLECIPLDDKDSHFFKTCIAK